MKTSNYILIFFLIVFIGGNFISILAAKNNLTVQVKSRYHFFGEKLNPFSVLVTESGTNLELSEGGSNDLIAENYEKGMQHIVSPYIVRNDTLFVSANPTSSNFTRVCISNGHKLKSIVAKEKSNIKIKETVGQHLSMKLYRAKLVIEDVALFNEVGRGSASIKATESDIVYEKGNYFKIEVDLINSNFISEWNSPELSGSVRKGSYLYHKFGRPEMVNLKVDKSSSCYIK